jgi:N utilization substance protein B
MEKKVSRPISPKARHQARKFAVQAIYQWQLSGDDVNEILVQYLVDMNTKRNDVDYFRELVFAVAQRATHLDELFVKYLDRPLDDIGPIELAILRMASYELNDRLDVPYKVVINEAVELTKIFGAEESHKYVNSILDKTAATLRAVEIKLEKN